MPIEILAPFVVVAVAVVMLVITRSGLSRKATLESAESVLERYRLDHPQTLADSVLIDDSATSAILVHNTVAIGLVRAVGDRTTTRQLSPGALDTLMEKTDGLELSLNDFTWTRQSIRLGNENDRRAWRKALEASA